MIMIKIVTEMDIRYAPKVRRLDIVEIAVPT